MLLLWLLQFVFQIIFPRVNYISAFLIFLKWARCIALFQCCCCCGSTKSEGKLFKVALVQNTFRRNSKKWNKPFTFGSRANQNTKICFIRKLSLQARDSKDHFDSKWTLADARKSSSQVQRWLDLLSFSCWKIENKVAGTVRGGGGQDQVYVRGTQ